MKETNNTASQGDTAPPVSIRFEAVGFLETRRRFDLLEDNGRDVQKYWKQVADVCGQHGFTSVEEAYLSEDDGQADTDIKVFVCIVLRGRSALVEYSRIPQDLLDALKVLAQAVCCSKSAGDDWVGAEHWELVEVMDAAECER